MLPFHLLLRGGLNQSSRIERMAEVKTPACRLGEDCGVARHPVSAGTAGPDRRRSRTRSLDPLLPPSKDAEMSDAAIIVREARRTDPAVES